jgi:hypothetical protein
MSDIKVYLNHGLGINSWGLYLKLIEEGEIPGETFEAVAIDHETDWPDSYKYLYMMLAKGYPVTVIKPKVQGYTNLYDYYTWKETIPHRATRDCTDKFKITPLTKYHQTPCVVYLGIDAGESHRARLHEKNGETFDYPLVNANIDRGGCIEIIKRHGLPVPPKSGCYICPFQGRKQWIELKRLHPDLFCKATKLENLCNERRAAAGKSPVYFRDLPLETLVLPKDGEGYRAKVGQGTLIDPDYDKPPCRCGL